MNLRIFSCLCSLLCYFNQSKAEVTLPRIFSDNMVLQRNVVIPIWGWASAREKISVRFQEKTYKTTASKDGIWSVRLPPSKAGGPYSLSVDASNHLLINNILIGDVWLCAGQSNMAHQMRLHSIRYAADIRSANFPEIRQFLVPNTANLQSSQDDLPGGNWKPAHPNSVLDFSAVAYFFARSLYEKYRVPIGIINASWGGIPIESMMSEEALRNFPNFYETLEKNKDTAFVNSWNRQFAQPSRFSAPPDRGLEEHWFETSYVPKNWRPISIPGFWEDQGVRDLHGVVWYRKEIDVPAAMASQDATVFLGRIVDADLLFINGIQVGQTTYLYPQRRYPVPKGVLRPGKNIFVIRVANYSGKGGFVPDKPYRLTTSNDTLNLSGEWSYKVGQVAVPTADKGSPILPQNQPAALFHSMIAPLVSYPLKGFAWYQGESNTGRAKEYAQLQPAMIDDWRKQWHQPEAPFLFVQLPGFGDMTYLPTESQWAEFREAQQASLQVPHTAMAVAIDLGEWNDIHPDRKKEVGERLALAARKLAYGEKDLIASGPIYESASIEGNQVTIRFTNTGSGLMTSDGEELSEFVIAGENKNFVRAKARIEGSTVIVWSEAVAMPKYVRYAWADCPVSPNLFNREGLPAAPFRTDEEYNK